MPKSNKMFQNIKLANSGKASLPVNNTLDQSRQVTFWAGLRVEGSLSPFGINADELTRWNDKINNGGLFEKIGNGTTKS